MRLSINWNGVCIYLNLKIKDIPNCMYLKCLLVIKKMINYFLQSY